MRVLVIDKAAEEKIKAVREFALNRRQTIHDIMRRMNRPDGAPGDDRNYFVELVDGWKVVYTIEQHPGGWFHHISVSIDQREKGKAWPSVQGVEMILKAFGLGTIKDKAHGWHEDTGKRKAVNLMFTFTEPAA